MAELRRRGLELTVGLLKVYNYYRVFIGLTLLIVYLQPLVETQLGRSFPREFLWLAVAYIALNFASAVTTHALPERLFQRQLLPVLVVLFDVAALTLLMYASGGVGSGLGIVILIAVAAGAVLLRGRLSTLMAAMATLLVLLEELILSFTHPELFTDYFQGGLLGAVYFATALAIRSLSSRMRSSEFTALERSAELAHLERINRSIVTRMRTGIIVVDPQNRIRLLNQSARSLLGMAREPEATPEALPEHLQQRLAAWRADTSTRTGPFKLAPTGLEIRANFSPIRPEEPQGDIIIFLEDTTDIQHQAQLLKLATLGRLSGTIAHEIRNPLGAISHAAQLLGESGHLDASDIRLARMIDSHCRRMNDVVENVLELSRRKPPAPRRLNLRTWLEELVTQFQQSAQSAAQIEVAVDPPETEIRVDPTQLGQALTNLLQNGLRYSRQRLGRPLARLEGGTDASTDRPYLNVIDYGPGVPDELIERLFEPFFTTEESGTGLGLYITREICEANQARISYHRHESGGGCFRINFMHPNRITA